MNTSTNFAGQAVLVTGASSGIGRALALQLAGQSARLVLVGRDAARLADAQAACAAAGAEAHAVLADLTLEDDCRRAVAEAVGRFGRLDALFCLAGQAMRGRFRDADNARATLDLVSANLGPVVSLCHHALPQLARAHGRVVVVAGLLGHVAAPGFAAYSAAKHAVVGFSRALRRELEPEGVALTLVSPDTVRSGVRASMRDASGRAAPLGYAAGEKVMEAEDCARAILDAAARREPERTLGRAGPMQALQAVAPGLLERLLRKSAAKARAAATARA